MESWDDGGDDENWEGGNWGWGLQLRREGSWAEREAHTENQIERDGDMEGGQTERQTPTYMSWICRPAREGSENIFGPS